MKKIRRWYKNINLQKRIVFSLNLTVFVCILIISVVATINRVNTQKTDAENSLYNELDHLTTVLDLTGERDMEEIKEVFYKKSFYNTGYASMIESDGNVRICQHNEGMNISGEKHFRDIESIAHGNSRYYDDVDGKWKWQYFTWYPPNQAYIVATIEEEEFLVKPVINTLKILLFALIFSFIVFGSVSYLIARSISKPINKLANVTDQLGKGMLAEKLDYDHNDEIGQMIISVNILVDGLHKTAIFAKEIGDNNFVHDYQPLSKDDVLGNALIDMRESLRKANEEEKIRKEEDEKRNWATQGLAKFGDILRQNYSNINELSYNVIKTLVEYLNANQGGLFIINDDSEDESKDGKFLELTACYAYDRRKFSEKKIEVGEGLVGACFIERQTIYLTDIPGDYISITSGLGQENPSALLIVPLNLNEEIYGIIEIASFNNFEDYQIDFVEKVGESIASTISNTKINQRTAMLLEKSHQQAEEMRAQEEEMRQNMEELNATQESMSEKDRENQRIINELQEEIKKKEEYIDELTNKLDKQTDELEDNTEEEPGNPGEEDDKNDESNTGSQQEWSEHLKKSTKQFKKGKKK